MVSESKAASEHPAPAAASCPEGSPAPSASPDGGEADGSAVTSPAEDQDAVAAALVPASAGLLDSVEEQRKRALVRMRLFGPPSTPQEVDPVRIGRFVPLRRLGAGGMGVVYVAYDEQLRREVAVKLLRSTEEEGRPGLLREAQALAQVTHPNIVTIYEVGESSQRVFIAMELVAGVSMREWMATRHSWQETVAIFLQAGQGLWAVHQHGLVHRDFKPENVMVGADGRVRIVDFGLARRLATTAAGAASPEPGSASLAAAPVDATVSPAGPLAGTPLYMAPEQYDPSALVDGRSDQFAFCVALFEALYGRRPFPGSTPVELLASMREGRRVEIPKALRAQVPDWLHGLLTRGLEYSAADRFPAMSDLLAELGRDRRSWRRRGRWLAAMTVLAVFSLFLGRKWQVAESERCQGGPRRIAEVWGDGEHALVRTLMQGAASPVAQDQWRRSEALLDRYSQGWSAMYGEACRAHQRREQSDVLFELRMRCLEQRRAQLRSTIAVLRELGKADEAVEVVLGLEPLASCADVTDLRAALQLPGEPDTRATVVALREALGRAEVEERAGRYSQALAIAQQVLQQSEATGYEPLIAEALFQRGAQESRLGRYEEAAASIEGAFQQAMGARHDQLAGQAANLLLYIRGHRQAKLDLASAWEKIAAALLRRRDNNHKLAVDFYGNRGLLRMAQGAHQEALADFQHALLAVGALYGQQHIKYARMLGNRAQVYFAGWNYALARRDQERALAIREENLGLEHPVIGSSLHALALTLLQQGELASAERLVLRALSIQTRSLGVEHPDVAATRATLADVLLHRGQYGPAQEQLDHAQRTVEARLPGTRLRLAAILLLRAQLLGRKEGWAASLAAAQRALSLYSEVLGPAHIDLAAARLAIGQAQLQLGQLAEAESQLQLALQTYERALGSGHAALAPSLIGLGKIAMLRHEPHMGCAFWARALTLYSTDPPSGENSEAQRSLTQLMSQCQPPGDRKL